VKVETTVLHMCWAGCQLLGEVKKDFRGHGRDRKTWNTCVVEDMRRFRLKREKRRRIAQLGGVIYGKPSDPCKCRNADVKH